jgi:hypothetical protein
MGLDWGLDKGESMLYDGEVTPTPRLMATPKLQLHSLSDDRPFLSSTKHLLTFLRGDDGTLIDVGIKLADSEYIQNVAPTDCDRFYVATDEIAAFLTTHNLVELPVTQEQLAYQAAFKAWIAAPESYNTNTTYYHALREAFIKFHVEQSPGRSFSKALYTTYCCC